METLRDYFLTDRHYRQVIDALWREFYPEIPRAQRGWEPSPAQVASIRVKQVWGIGAIGVGAINMWLEDCGELPKRPVRRRQAFSKDELRRRRIRKERG